MGDVEEEDQTNPLKFAPRQFEHELSETCWCEPEIEFMADGTIVVIHRRDDN